MSIATLPQPTEPSMSNDYHLVQQVVSGSHLAFDNMYHATIHEIKSWIAYRSYRWDMIEECVQQTYITAHRHMEKFHPDGELIPWLKGIARHEVLKYLDRIKRQSRHDEAAFAMAQLRVVEEEHDESDDSVSDELEKCLSRLPPQTRALVWRRYVENASVEGMAQVEQRNVNAISVALHRARKALRKCLGGGA